ncbi:WcaF family extracellular polysaccharide biosynthesis acetyltransferase [Rufibacter hautae]|uniref:Colanic acid biosynthesis acetyltransferase WcaF n=1 Tax=Rufibacter hautae TaxID=2595005 RepID=A0A5B6TH74_9BACT|nr:WcaF family extracellular polysaccharide biosynthesis acetyltransferase [Rufibacter hautae]KAA3439603.1 colanic acid biosynthesis acetyltransferase WcaF [Rufibacter hautae]
MYNKDTVTGPSFSFYNRFFRLVWQLTATLFFTYSPKQLHGWRSFLLRLFGAKVGRGVHVYPKVKIWAPWNLQLEDQCGIANGVILYSQGKIIIGRRAVVSQGAHLCTGTHDYTELGFPLVTKPIQVGDFAWVAAEAFVHPGVTIGEGCVIGARAVVTKDMPAWMVCSGHPCKPIKDRMEEKIQKERFLEPVS